jgi:hypothetical protein
LKEQAIFGRNFRTAAEVRAAVSEFVERYNTYWRLASARLPQPNRLSGATLRCIELAHGSMMILYSTGKRPILPSRPGLCQASARRGGCAWHGHWIGGESPSRGELVATASRAEVDPAPWTTGAGS